MICNIANAIGLQRHHEPRRIRRYAGGARYHSPVELRGEQQLARRRPSSIRTNCGCCGCHLEIERIHCGYCVGSGCQEGTPCRVPPSAILVYS